ncbi:low specificity L-threonine aldolase [Citricoccus sp. SGAir0253]|uniref:threonine aldolase family protein n=1 Tax=Citricoccus sp. SGAir0253 TaxID=2567881 RepID=UPI001AF01F40|nr:beta-eliminating lyase-related protein [Citricoccus sp. SGAir0253]
MSGPGDREVPAAARRGFASDNYAGAHPEVLAALAAANTGHQPAYGDDEWTARLQGLVRAEFGDRAQAFPVFNGTGANVVALQALLPPWGAVVCAESAHIHHDEGGAPERVAHTKLYPVPTPDGRLTPELVDRQAHGLGFVHRAQPAVVEIAQVTELGTVYTPAQVRELADHAHALGMAVYMDGARLANAAAALGVPLRSFTTDAGVDVVSLGGTKNGALGAEAVVVLDPDAVRSGAEGPGKAVEYLRKSSMQLASKMRFVSAQLVALLTDGLWLRSAAHANAMAARLADGVRDLEGVTLTQEPAANQVLAVLDPAVADAVRARYAFYDWDAARHEVRWMTSWDTTEEDVDGFLAALRAELAARDRSPAGADR